MVLARDGFGHKHAFFLGFVGQHGSFDDVADGVDVRYRSLQVTVHGNAAAFRRG